MDAYTLSIDDHTENFDVLDILYGRKSVRLGVNENPEHKRIFGEFTGSN